jgi:DNA-directed RNA polymerase subunit K/omega
MKYYDHVMLGEPKEAPRVDVQRAVRMFGQEQYKLILVAAARARDIERKYTIACKAAGKILPQTYKPINAALKEIIDGELTPEGIK